jgi:guanylate kinase
MAQAQGQLFIISAPSGGGKTSLVNALLAKDERLRVSVSHTTRAERPGETDGVNYHFVDPARFEQMIAAGEFLEHAQVFGNRYGTSREAVLSLLQMGFDVILEIDWQGAQQVLCVLPGCIGIFILPPSRAELSTRLRNRGEDDEATILRREAAATAEMSHYAEYDYLVINAEFEHALADLQAIVQAARLRTPSQAARIPELLSALVA